MQHLLLSAAVSVAGLCVCLQVQAEPPAGKEAHAATQAAPAKDAGEHGTSPAPAAADKPHNDDKLHQAAANSAGGETETAAPVRHRTRRHKPALVEEDDAAEDTPAKSVLPPGKTGSGPSTTADEEPVRGHGAAALAMSADKGHVPAKQSQAGDSETEAETPAASARHGKTERAQAAAAGEEPTPGHEPAAVAGSRDQGHADSKDKPETKGAAEAETPAAASKHAKAEHAQAAEQPAPAHAAAAAAAVPEQGHTTAKAEHEAPVNAEAKAPAASGTHGKEHGPAVAATDAEEPDSHPTGKRPPAEDGSHTAAKADPPADYAASSAVHDKALPAKNTAARLAHDAPETAHTRPAGKDEALAEAHAAPKELPAPAGAIHKSDAGHDREAPSGPEAAAEPAHHAAGGHEPAANSHAKAVNAHAEPPEPQDLAAAATKHGTHAKLAANPTPAELRDPAAQEAARIGMPMLGGKKSLHLPAANSSHTGPAFDLRILVDVSGSMKQTDPNNLRIPALKMIAELLPPDGRGGVWSFGKGVETLVPLGKTDKAWKAKALAAANKIHSRDVYTDIEKALDASTADWKAPAEAGTPRQIILLTDGKVDIDKDAEVSKASQQRVTNEILPRLRNMGAKLHAIALSEAADQQLLQQLAVDSDGSFELAAKADQLQRVFLHRFEHTTPRDTLPMKNNRFHVDGSVDELTLLVFRKKPEAQTSVILPDGQELNASSKLEGLRWHREGQYDLATFAKPPPGDWQIKGAIDPDNRAMIVTNLKLKIKEPPNNIVLGEHLDLNVSLVGGDKPITQRELLELVKVGGVHMGEDKIKNTFEFKGPNDVGAYKVTIGEELRDGKNELQITAKSPTFERERRFEVEAFAHPVDVTAKAVADNKGHSGYAIQFVPKPGLIDLEGSTLTANVIDPQGKSHEVEVQPATDEGWSLLMQRLDNRKIVLKGKIAGVTVRGQEVEFETLPLSLGEPAAGDHAEASHEATAAKESAHEVPTPAAEPAAAPTPAAAASPGASWAFTAGTLLSANIVLGVSGLFGFKWYKRRKAASAAVDLGI